MKKIAFVLFLLYTLVPITAFTIDSTADENVASQPDTHITQKEYDYNENIYYKYKMTPTQAKHSIIIGGVLSGSGSLFIAAACIMGFIPYECMPDSMKVFDSFQYGNDSIWRIDYPYMTAYGAVGISMAVTGVIMFLFTMPLLIYGSVCIWEYNKQSRVSLQGSSISIKLGDIPRKRSIL